MRPIIFHLFMQNVQIFEAFMFIGTLRHSTGFGVKIPPLGWHILVTFRL